MARKFYLPDSLVTYGVIFVVIVLSFYVAAQFIEPAPPRSFKLAAGSKDGAYSAYAQDFKERLAAIDTNVEIIHSSGSFENIRLLKEGKADFAFVQSGLSVALDQETSALPLTSLGSMYFEPLWIFTSNNFGFETLRDFTGLKLSIGSQKSGTYHVAKKLLNASGVNDSNATFFEIGGAEAITALKNGDIDVAFISAGVSSSIVKDFMDDPDIFLFSEDRAVAYSKNYPYLSHLTLPEGVLDLADNQPDKEINLLSSAAMILAGPQAHPVLKTLMVQKAHTIFEGEGPYLQTVDFPNGNYVDFPMAGEAERYYKYGPSLLHKYLPFWIADLVDRLKVMLIPLITIMFPLMKIAPPTYRWRIRSKIYKWYKDLKKAEKVDKSSQNDVYEAISRLDEMDSEAKETPVPLAYTDALYNLRMHIGMVKEKLRNTKMDDDARSERAGSSVKEMDDA